jgi:hypothetical protein
MPILFKRLRHYAYNNNLPLLSVEQRIELGKIVMSEYQLQDKITEPIQKVKINEPETGDILVCSYPKGFVYRIDELIRDYYKEHSPPVKKERKRIPVKKPAYQARKPKPLK